MTYGFLLESVWHPPLLFAEDSLAALPPELELQALWFSGALGRDFRTQRGQMVRIVQFGGWNRSAGPDFSQVAVEIDGHVHTGSLELDPQSGCWKSHGHAGNPAFNDVVLHVVFQAGMHQEKILTSDGREVPQVLITDIQLADALNRPQREVAISHPGRCVFPLKRISNAAVERLLCEAAQHRAGLKAIRWLRVEQAHGRDQALFHATAETLGYRGNQLSMKLLAQRAPLSMLQRDKEGFESLLFGIAGFLNPYLHELARPDTQDYLRHLWDDWWQRRTAHELPSERAIEWKTGNQRPANHPHRRVGALAALVPVWAQYRKLALAAPFEVKPLIDFLQGVDHDFWSHRHTLGSVATEGRVALIGRAQAIELVANHLAPLAMHENRMTFRDYQKLRHSAANEKVKRCGLRLFGSEKDAKPWTKRVYHHQALLQVYQDFCLEDFSDCHDCPFPEQLQQWR